MAELSPDEQRRLLDALSVRELVEMRGWTVLERHLRDLRAKIAEQVLTGAFERLDEVARLQGEAQGLEEAHRYADECRRTAKELQKRMEG